MDLPINAIDMVVAVDLVLFHSSIRHSTRVCLPSNPKIEKGCMVQSKRILLVTMRNLVLATTALGLKSLQVYHPAQTPAEALQELSQFSANENKLDVYGDFENSPANSTLRHFEAELAQMFGYDDAVFMPSGVMAQAIALLIHDRGSGPKRNAFAVHPTSHLLLHEKEAHSQLLGMHAVIIEPQNDQDNSSLLTLPPILFPDVRRTLEQWQSFPNNQTTVVSTLIVECPHRELGGTLTPWDDLQRIKEYCTAKNIRLHCDGARIFEAASGYEKELSEFQNVFDSLYISFYKGLGGMAGACLLGDTAFCNEARVWLRRFGGNLYTLFPYIQSARLGLERYWKNTEHRMTFSKKKEKLATVLVALEQDAAINKVVAFEPSPPQVNMVHGFMKRSKHSCEAALDRAEMECGIRALHRLRELPRNHPAYQKGYRTGFEWNMGEANGQVATADFVMGWRSFATALQFAKTPTNY